MDAQRQGMNKRAKERQKEILERRYSDYQKQVAAYNEQAFDSPQRIVGAMFLRTERNALRDEFKALGVRIPFDVREPGD